MLDCRRAEGLIFLAAFALCISAANLPPLRSTFHEMLA